MRLVTLFANLSFTMQEIKKTESNIMLLKKSAFQTIDSRYWHLIIISLKKLD